MKVFLFDFDGVVIDTLPIAVETYNSLLQKYEIPYQFTQDEFAKLFLNNFHHSLSAIVTDNAIKENILKERAEEYTRRVNDFVVFEGMKDVLNQLSQGNKVIVISSNRTSFIEKLLSSREIDIFSEVLGGDIEKSKVKKIGWQKEEYPDSDIYYIGDTAGDIKEGKESGVITVGTTWGFHSPEVVAAENPDYLFHNPLELLQLLN